MKVKITGDFRDVAYSAWISTTNEIRAKCRSDDDARRVVKFLVDNHHSSPLESVTITFEYNNSSDVSLDCLNKYMSDKYCRVENNDGNFKFSIDLLNFVKITSANSLFDQSPWVLFAEARPELSLDCSGLKPLGSKNFESDVSHLLGNHNMGVELVNFHDAGSLHLSRATWRVKCPLSIAVQMLRHRAGSYNMVSGRYKTIVQEMVSAVDDCSDIFSKVDVDLSEFLNSTSAIVQLYKDAMSKAKQAKNNKIISNNEYKRFREFARFILPEGRMTELYVTYYLDDFYNNYLPLRNSEHAQVEHIWVAQEMMRVLENARV